MGWRLYRRKQIAPGVRLNFSRSGPSVRLGPRGAGITLGGRYGRRTTVGIPGTGVYYTSYGHHSRRRAAPAVSHRSVSTASASSNKNAGIGCLVLLGTALAIGGIVATSGLILIPIVLGLIAWGAWHYRRPKSQAQRLIAQAQKLDSPERVLTLHQALQLAPNEPQVELACANIFYDLECWVDASQCYGEYLHHQPSLMIEAKYVQALLRAGQLEEAIDRLAVLRSQPGLSEQAASSVVANLALAFLLKGDPEQAEALVDQAVGGKRNLDEGLQQCLLLRGIARYSLGQRAAAIRDMERLYAAASNPDVLRDKTAMQDGTYKVDSFSPYPAWYPHERLEQAANSAESAAPAPPPPAQEAPVGSPSAPAAAGPAVNHADAPTARESESATVPSPPGQLGWLQEAGRWRSPDGQMIWDGKNFLSPDGSWVWDGHAWSPKPVEVTR